MKRPFMLAAAMAALAAACSSSPTRLLDEAGGAVSQTLCSKTFVSRLDPERSYRDHLLPEPGMSLIAWGLRYEIDLQRQQVRARAPGGPERLSVYREGRGCTLTYAGQTLPRALEPRGHAEALLPEIAGADVVAPADPALARALDAAFAEPDNGPPRATKAIVVVHRGRVIAERYAPGFSATQPLLGHSLAKSVTHALVGLLVRDGKLSLTDAAPVAAWAAAGDRRGAITIDQLLRMSAGFGFDEGAGAGVATHMWYTEPDMSGYAERATLKDAPGAAWGYCSRCYTILSHIISNTLGDPQAVHDYAQRELFDPLGMRDVTIEFDSTGVMMGANAILATPRDWARFGLLYLHDGIVGGRRILPGGWAQHARTPTLQTGYGAGFWLSNTDEKVPVWGSRWGLPGAPRDAFMGRGYLGQYVIVVPSKDLVVVRFGASHARNAEIESVGRLTSDVIAALPR